MTDYAQLYLESRERITGLVRKADAGQLATVVPGCPRWSVADTVAHLSAVAAEAMSGRLAGIPGDEETAEQVRRRRDLPLEDVLAEWEAAGARVEQGLRERALPLPIVHDVITHEADLRGALGAGRPPASAWSASLGALVRHLGELSVPGTLVIRTRPEEASPGQAGAGQAGADELTAGSGEPVTILDVDPYELWRAWFGRRSVAQMARWRWTGDSTPYLAALPVFGPTEQDLTEPE